jgi:hypothetical protein
MPSNFQAGPFQTRLCLRKAAETSQNFVGVRPIGVFVM